MSEKNVIISILGQQSVGGERSDPVELVTNGVLCKHEDAYILSYQESEITGMAGTLTTFYIEPERVTLLRVGEFNAQVVFQKGQRNESIYNMPYGQITMGVHTLRMRAEVNGEEGMIDLVYNVEVNYQLSATNTFHIQFREKKVGPTIFAGRPSRRWERSVELC